MNTAAIKTHASRLPFGSIVYTVIVTVLGVLLICAGIAMLVLPGPGILVIFLGLGLLGTEFPWAQRLILRIKAWAQPYMDRVTDWWKARRNHG